MEFIFFPVINEGCRVVEERIVDKPSDLDVAAVLGMGFPPYRGGLIKFADLVGAKHIVARLKVGRPSVPSVPHIRSSSRTRAPRDGRIGFWRMGLFHYLKVSAFREISLPLPRRRGSSSSAAWVWADSSSRARIWRSTPPLARS